MKPKMILAAPVVNGHELTTNLINNFHKTTSGDTKFVVVDNSSDTPYKRNEPLYDLLSYDENKGYYYPLIDLYNEYPDAEYIGLIHNDMVLYEQGWDIRMQQAFADDPQLGLIGLCGSNEIDQLGGRGGGTMVFFRGGAVQVGNITINGQSQDAGARIHGVEPSLCLDSLFMMFRREVIPHLHNERDPWENVTLAHFYDRIWPIRTIEAGYRVATMGVECDHLGGMTTTGNERYRDDCIKWLDERGYEWRLPEGLEPPHPNNDPEYRRKPSGNPETQMYLVAEDRYLTEYREEKRFLPAIVDKSYGIRYLAR